MKIAPLTIAMALMIRRRFIGFLLFGLPLGSMGSLIPRADTSRTGRPRFSLEPLRVSTECGSEEFSSKFLNPCAFSRMRGSGRSFKQILDASGVAVSVLKVETVAMLPGSPGNAPAAKARDEPNIAPGANQESPQAIKDV